ncbi:hypothetical protein B566_EDAN007841 [Ephemera danica]|nr:hypothetical protein B566_EDAN007841 [Ephemera danica]
MLFQNGISSETMKSLRIIAHSAMIVILSTLALRVRANPECTQEEMLRCSFPLKVITDNKELTFVTSKQELDLQCPQLLAGLQCIDSFTHRCMNPNDRHEFMRLYNGTKGFINDLCRDGNYQTEFLQHEPCMRKVRVDADLEVCTKNYESQLHHMNHARFNDSIGPPRDSEFHMRTICCSFKKYVDCSLDVIERRCGTESANFTSHIFARMGNPFVKNHCTKYSQGDNCIGDSGSWWSTKAQLQLVVLCVVLTLVKWPLLG